MQIKQIRIKRKRFILRVSPNKRLFIMKGPLGLVQENLPFQQLNDMLFFPTKALANSFFLRLRESVKALIYGYFVELRTEGVGLKFIRYYRSPRVISLSLGFSHTILFRVPKTIQFRCLKYRLLLFSNSQATLSTTALRIRSYRPPDAYKGKGVKFSTEVLKIKPGKQRQR